MGQPDINELFVLLHNLFGDSIAPLHFKPSMGINEFQDNGYQLIVISAKGAEVEARPWPISALANRWHNTNRPYTLLERLANNIKQRNTHSLNVSQLVMTEDEEDLKQAIIPGNPMDLKAFVNTLRYPSGFIRYIGNVAQLEGDRLNIVSADFVDNEEIFQACMQENMRHIPRS